MLRIGTMIALLACCVAVSAQTSAPARVQVSNEIMLGRVEHKTMPVYPEEAMKKGIQGDVVFKIDVDETGKITASVPVSGDPLLTAATSPIAQVPRNSAAASSPHSTWCTRRPGT